MFRDSQVEAGMALALGKPSVYLIGEPKMLPYILRQASNTTLPAPYGSIATHWLTDSMSAAALVARHKIELFNAG